MSIQFEISRHKLIFKHPFKLAHTARTFTEGAFLLAEIEGQQGTGEIVFPPYYEENYESFQRFIKALPPLSFSSIDQVNEFIQNKLDTDPSRSFAISALDIALHNLLSSNEGIDIHQHYELAPPKSNSASSLTIGICDSKELIERIKEIKSAPKCDLVKLKVSEDSIATTIQTFTQNCSLPFSVDANQGFRTIEAAKDWAFKLHELGCLYLEQPFAKEDLIAHRQLKDQSPIPILADESFQTYDDFHKIKDAFDGVNIKLMKCGGIGQAIKCLKTAKQLNLKTVVGCMSEYQYAIEAAWQVSSLADWIDLDGPFLIKKLQSI